MKMMQTRGTTATDRITILTAKCDISTLYDVLVGDQSLRNTSEEAAEAAGVVVGNP